MTDLNIFINNLLKQSKNDQDLIKQISDLSLKGGIELFLQFFENVPTKDKAKIVDTVFLKNRVLSAIAKEPTFDPLIIKRFEKNGFAFTVKDYKTIKQDSNYTDGQQLLDDLIFSDKHKNQRIKDLYSFMQLYTKANQNNETIAKEVFEEYAKKLSFKTILREKKVVKIAPYQTYNKSITNSRNYNPKTKEITRNLKSQEQKDFDFLFPDFAKFLAANIKEDFVQVLSLLDLDFLGFLNKVLTFDNDLSITKKLFDSIDLQNFYNNLPQKEQLKFDQCIQKIRNVALNKSTVSYHYYDSFDTSINKKTKEAGKLVFEFVNALKNKNFSHQQIKNIFDVFTNQLQLTHTSAANGGDIIYNTIIPMYKPVTKKDKDIKESFLIDYEKEKLQQIINTQPTTHKVKINKL